jgi:hypothetical protein
MSEGGFGGLCERGHDVPPGARYCPSCGSPAHGPSVPQGPEADPYGQPPVPPPSAPSRPYPGGGHPPGGSPGYCSGGPLPGPAGYGQRQPAPTPPGYGYPVGPPPPGWYRPPPPLPLHLRSYWSYGPPAGTTNGLAIASMIFGILWIWWIGSILAVVLGHVALHQTRSSGQGGRGMAIAGVVLGYFGLAMGIIVIIATAASG